MSRAVDSTLPGYQRAQRGRVVGPAERRVRPQRRREPGVEHVGRLLPAVALGPVDLHHVGAVGREPDRQPVAPPQLARDAPGPDRLHPVEEDLLEPLRVERDAARCGRPSMAVSASSSILQNHCSDTIGSTRAPERWQKPTEWCSGCSADDAALERAAGRARPRGPPRARSPPTPAAGRAAGRCSSMNSSVSSPWSRPISKSIGSWPGVTFRRARAEADLDAVVADDRHRPVDQRHDRRAPDQVLPARVVGMHGDAGVGQDRHGPHGRDHDLAAALDVVAHRVQHVVDVAVLDLEVGDGGLQRPRPVHEPVVAVDVAALVQAHEHLDDRARVARRPS